MSELRAKLNSLTVAEWQQFAELVSAAGISIRVLSDAELEHQRDGGSMASATRKDAAPTAAEPAVLHASIDPPASLTRMGCITIGDDAVEVWVSANDYERMERAYWRAAFGTPASETPEPRCRCTHRWAEHYGTKSDAHPERGCQRGCGCRAFVEPEVGNVVC